MPKGMKKETRVTYDSVIQPQYLLITRSICFHSILDLHATTFIQYYISIFYIIKIILKYSSIYMNTYH